MGELLLTVAVEEIVKSGTRNKKRGHKADERIQTNYAKGAKGTIWR